MARRHTERHRTDRVGWLRAAVLGANHAILSTVSLVLGVAAAHGNHWNVMVAGVAALFARACRWRTREVVGHDNERFDAYGDFAIRPPITDSRVLPGRHVCSQGVANGP